MIQGFDFENGGRRYSCSVEARADGEQWWWFSVTSDAQRYAPFRAERADTRASVQSRIVEFYDHRILRLAEPRTARSHFGTRKPATPAPSTSPAT